MGFTDSLKKVIGIEEMDEDDFATEEELREAKEKLMREPKRESFFRAPEENETSTYTEKKPSSSSSYSRSTEKRYSVTNTSSLKLILIEPKSFDECPKLVDSLKARKPVIINLEKLETEIARKMFDFLNGATYALNGNVQKIANNIFIFTPENVAVSSSQPAAAAAVEPETTSPWR